MGVGEDGEDNSVEFSVSLVARNFVPTLRLQIYRSTTCDFPSAIQLVEFYGTTDVATKAILRVVQNIVGIR